MNSFLPWLDSLLDISLVYLQVTKPQIFYNPDCCELCQYNSPQNVLIHVIQKKGSLCVDSEAGGTALSLFSQISGLFS